MNNLLFMAAAIILIAGNLMVGNATPVEYGEMNSSSYSYSVDPDDESPKEIICEGVGCEDGRRKCADPEAKITIGYKGTGIEVGVKFYCYEPFPEN